MDSRSVTPRPKPVTRGTKRAFVPVRPNLSSPSNGRKKPHLLFSAILEKTSVARLSVGKETESTIQKQSLPVNTMLSAIKDGGCLGETLPVNADNDPAIPTEVQEKSPELSMPSPVIEGSETNATTKLVEVEDFGAVTRQLELVIIPYFHALNKQYVCLDHVGSTADARASDGNTCPHRYSVQQTAETLQSHRRRKVIPAKAPGRNCHAADVRDELILNDD